MHVPRHSSPACITSNKVYWERKILAAVSWSLLAENYCFYKKILSAATIAETVKYHRTQCVWMKCVRECVV